MAVFNSSIFNDAPGTLLTASSPISGGPIVSSPGYVIGNQPTIETGGVTYQNTNTLYCHYFSGSPAGTDYSAKVRCNYTAGANRPIIGVIVCQDTSVDTAYQLYYFPNFGSPFVAIDRRVAGTPTAIGTVALPGALPFDVYDIFAERTVSGGNVSLAFYIQRVSDNKYFDASAAFVSGKTAVTSAVDSTSPILANGKAGLLGQVGTISPADINYTSFISQDFATAPPAGTVTISGASSDATSSAITYSYSASDQDSFEYTLNGGGSWTAIGNSPGTITGLSEYTAYTVSIRAINAFGNGTASSGFNFTTDNVGRGTIEIPTSGGSGGGATTAINTVGIHVKIGL